MVEGAKQLQQVVFTPIHPEAITCMCTQRKRNRICCCCCCFLKKLNEYSGQTWIREGENEKGQGNDDSGEEWRERDVYNHKFGTEYLVDFCFDCLPVCLFSQSHSISLIDLKLSWPQISWNPPVS